MKELQNKVALKDLFDIDDERGLISPREDEEYIRREKIVSELNHKLHDSLTKEQYKLFEKYMDAYFDMEYVELLYAYSAGFSKCVQLYLETIPFRNNLEEIK